MEMELKNRLMQYGDVECGEPLCKHTTFRIGGKAKYYVYPKNELCLSRIIALAKEERVPYKLFGKGLLMKPIFFHLGFRLPNARC